MKVQKIFTPFLSKIFTLLEMSYFNQRYTTYRSKYNIHKTFRFSGKNIELYGEGIITLGKESYMGNNSTIQSLEKQSVKIGDFVSISHNVRFYSSNRDPKYICTESNIKPIYKSGNILIEDNVWIGANCVILEGTHIKNNVVVAANSILKGVYGPNCIVSSDKAKTVKTYNG